ncbi:hypothetical protein ACFQAT_08195 [Undibacterium arcticum]|uniref:hypothetical protein n=1 Tax=Undibacterium arcticum TaxID=1762892 RepID=UPI003618D16B
MLPATVAPLPPLIAMPPCPVICPVTCWVPVMTTFPVMCCGPVWFHWVAALLIVPSPFSVTVAPCPSENVPLPLFSSLKKKAPLLCTSQNSPEGTLNGRFLSL